VNWTSSAELRTVTPVDLTSSTVPASTRDSSPTPPFGEYSIAMFLAPLRRVRSPFSRSR
jgi:hypothetical protein